VRLRKVSRKYVEVMSGKHSEGSLHEKNETVLEISHTLRTVLYSSGFTTGARREVPGEDHVIRVDKTTPILRKITIIWRDRRG
jgi:hypothetical protein